MRAFFAPRRDPAYLPGRHPRNHEIRWKTPINNGVGPHNAIISNSHISHDNSAGANSDAAANHWVHSLGITPTHFPANRGIL